MANWRQLAMAALLADGTIDEREVEILRREFFADRRIATIPNVTTRMVEDAGHMLHHDQPEALARIIEDFLG